MSLSLHVTCCSAWPSLQHVCALLMCRPAVSAAAGICSYLFLYVMNFGMDLIDVARKRRTLDAVVYDNCPDAFQVCGRDSVAVWCATGSAADAS